MRNRRTQSLPHVAVWFKTLGADGALNGGFRLDVGITDLGLLQVGTIWSESICNRRLALQECEFNVDFSPGHWRFTSQREHHSSTGALLIPESAYPLTWGARDKSQLLAFELPANKQLLVPSLEFYSRYYGRSGHVLRVLATYPWADAEERLYLPFEYPSRPNEWPIKLASSAYNADALFLAHVKYDPYAMQAAKSVYAGLEAQYEENGGLAFPRIRPWFQGPANLIVQGLWLDERRFLALRIEGGSDPGGPNISVFRENPGQADEAAPDGAPLSRWKGGRDLQPATSPSIVNLTPEDEPDHKGNIVEILNPAFRVVGARREIVRRRLANAETRPGPPKPVEGADKHSPGERYGSARGTGVASIHTQVVLESDGAARDVWNALQYLRRTLPHQILAVGWYNTMSGKVQCTDEPSMVALTPFEDEERFAVDPSVIRWLFADAEQSRPRGVLVSYVQTPERAAFLFEIERRRLPRTADDGREYSKEEQFSGLVVASPSGAKPSEWIPTVLDGIRRKRGVMERVASYCQDLGAADYRRTASSGDQIAGHSTVVNALKKVGIELPKPKAMGAVQPQNQGAVSTPAGRRRPDVDSCH